MDWANERYVRLYTRDSTTWKLWDWRARTVLMLMLRKATRAGVIDVDGHGARGLAALIELPIDIVEAGIEQLTDPEIGTVIATPTAYVIPKYLEAQEATQTTAHRSREYRARQRDEAMAAGLTVTKRDDSVTKRDGTVTKSDSSPEISSLLSDPIRAYPDRGSEKSAISSPRQLPDSRKAEPSRLAESSAEEISTRRKLVDSGLAELNAVRARVAAKFGWRDVRALHPMDACTRDLRERLSESGAAGEEQLRHVLRIAELDAIAQRSVQYLGGGIFSERSWSKKLGMTERDAARAIGTNQPEPQRLKPKSRPDDDMPPLPPDPNRGKA